LEKVDNTINDVDRNLEKVTEAFTGNDGESTRVAALCADDTTSRGDVGKFNSVTTTVIQCDGNSITSIDISDLEVDDTTILSSAVDGFHEHDFIGGFTIIGTRDGGVPAGGVVTIAINACLFEENNSIGITGDTIETSQFTRSGDEGTITSVDSFDTATTDGTGGVDQ